MTPAPENPPAFPQPVAGCTDGCVYETKSVGGPASAGMSLRDWFAGQAMAAMIPSITKESHVDTISKGAYVMADAMLIARAQPKPTP